MPWFADHPIALFLLYYLIYDLVYYWMHHMLRDPEQPRLHHCNYGQVLPVWDRLFGTALYGVPLRPTGVGDPAVDADNGRGVIAMQWHSLRRFWGAVSCRAGWRPGDVPIHDDAAAPPAVRAARPEQV